MKKLVFCRCEVKKKAVRREVRNGIEHIIISAATLPDNVVMNGGLYPAEEIERSFHGLERTLAPVEHPIDGSGNYVSARDPEAIHNFHAGAWNQNVTRTNGRVYHDIIINVQEALRTDRGRRLLDRIEEIENNDGARAIHTSVGVWLDAEMMEKPEMNSDGQAYTWVGRNLEFDHNAILLDSVGAATPEQGVGIAVNRAGERMAVEKFELTDGPGSLSPTTNKTDSEMSQDDTRQAIRDALERSPLEEPDYIEEIYSGYVVYRSEDGFYRVPYRIDEGTATIVGMPELVERKVTYQPLTANEGNETMKSKIVNALTEAGIATDNLSDDELFEQFQTLQANNQHESGDDSGAGDQTADIAAAVTAALQPLTEKVDRLEANMNQQADAEKTQLVELITNSGQFPGLDGESANLLPIDKLKAMAANCGRSFGVPLSAVNAGSNGEADDIGGPAEMPE